MTDSRPPSPESQIPSPGPIILSVEPRAAAFARLFEAVHEGVYIGTIGPDGTSTIAANPHLKLIFGYASEAPDAEVRPFDHNCFVDPQARAALVARLSADGAVGDYLLRLRRADKSAVWVEVTAAAEPLFARLRLHGSLFLALAGVSTLITLGLSRRIHRRFSDQLLDLAPARRRQRPGRGARPGCQRAQEARR